MTERRDNLANKTVNPTRMELTRLKRKLKTAVRGHKLLKDKRDELMKQFLDLVRVNKALRETVEDKIKKSNKQFAIASAAMSKEVLDAALLSPKQEVYLEVQSKNVMSVTIPVFETKTKSDDPNDIYSYGYAFTSPELDDSVKDLLMASEIEKTRRRVNALEHVMIPEMQQNIKYIVMKLDENERSTQIRLMKVKDMVLEQKHHYKEKE